MRLTTIEQQAALLVQALEEVDGTMPKAQRVDDLAEAIRAMLAVGDAGALAAVSEPKSSMGMTSPTAAQRGGGLPQVEHKVYYDHGTPGAMEQAHTDLTAEYQALLDWRPATAVAE